MNHLLAAALLNAARGWPVIPLRPGSKIPALHGETNCPRTGDCTNSHRKFEQRATTDPDRIRAAWEPYFAQATDGHGSVNTAIRPRR